jgi:hypothetical protein
LRKFFGWRLVKTGNRVNNVWLRHQAGFLAAASALNLLWGGWVWGKKTLSAKKAQGGLKTPGTKGKALLP